MPLQADVTLFFVHSGWGLVVLVGEPRLGYGEVVIVGGGYPEETGREAYALLKCIYIYIYIFEFSSAMFSLTGDFYPCIFSPWIPTSWFRFLGVVDQIV